jgi:hypothetical protein
MQYDDPVSDPYMQAGSAATGLGTPGGLAGIPPLPMSPAAGAGLMPPLSPPALMLGLAGGGGSGHVTPVAPSAAAAAVAGVGGGMQLGSASTVAADGGGGGVGLAAGGEGGEGGAVTAAGLTAMLGGSGGDPEADTALISEVRRLCIGLCVATWQCVYSSQGEGDKRRKRMTPHAS